jgi:hypothetical protein
MLKLGKISLRPNSQNTASPLQIVPPSDRPALRPPPLRPTGIRPSGPPAFRLSGSPPLRHPASAPPPLRPPALRLSGFPASGIRPPALRLAPSPSDYPSSFPIIGSTVLARFCQDLSLSRRLPISWLCSAGERLVANGERLCAVGGELSVED